MTFHGYRDKALQDRQTLEKLAEGKKPRAIAAEIGIAYPTLRRRLSRYVHAIGCETVEQAVAVQTAAKIKASLPLALHGQVDLVMKGRR